YLAVLVCAAALLRGRAALSAVEPALAMGAAIVVTYGLSERLLPGVLHFQRSLGAAGRLEQPLTYWNAMGALAAMGMVLCARLAGDATRAVALRTGAVVAAAPLGTGFYLTLSRGAYGALIAGLLTLVFLSPTRSQLRGAALVLLTAAVPALVAGNLGSVQTLHGTLAHREAQGGLALAVLVAAALAGGIATILIARSEHAGRLRTAAVALPRRALPLHRDRGGTRARRPARARGADSRRRGLGALRGARLPRARPRDDRGRRGLRHARRTRLGLGDARGLARCDPPHGGAGCDGRPPPLAAHRASRATAARIATER